MQLNCQREIVFVYEKFVVIPKLIVLNYCARALEIVLRQFAAALIFNQDRFNLLFHRILDYLRQKFRNPSDGFWASSPGRCPGQNSTAKNLLGETSARARIVIVRVREALIKMCSQLREKTEFGDFFDDTIGSLRLILRHKTRLFFRLSRRALSRQGSSSSSSCRLRRGCSIHRSYR